MPFDITSLSSSFPSSLFPNCGINLCWTMLTFSQRHRPISSLHLLKRLVRFPSLPLFSFPSFLPVVDIGCFFFRIVLGSSPFFFRTPHCFVSIQRCDPVLLHSFGVRGIALSSFFSFSLAGDQESAQQLVPFFLLFFFPPSSARSLRYSEQLFPLFLPPSFCCVEIAFPLFKST